MKIFTTLAYVVISCESIFQLIALALVVFALVVFGVLAYKTVCVITSFLLNYRKVDVRAGKDGFALQACEYR